MIHGDKGDKGDAGEAGPPGGPPGPSAAFTNYAEAHGPIGDGLTRTVASVTVPAGSYVLSAVVSALDVDDLQFRAVRVLRDAGGQRHGEQLRDSSRAGGRDAVARL